MSKIYREVVVLGVSTKSQKVVDFDKIPEGKKWGSLSDEEKEKLPRYEAIPVTFLACDFSQHTPAQGYLGELKLFPYNCPVTDTNILKALKPDARLLLGINQYIRKDGKVSEQIVSVQAVTVSK